MQDVTLVRTLARGMQAEGCVTTSTSVSSLTAQLPRIGRAQFIQLFLFLLSLTLRGVEFSVAGW